MRLIATGFTGVSLDTQGYDDHGAAYRYGFDAAIGSYPTFRSSDGRYLFYDLRSFGVGVHSRYTQEQLDQLKSQTLSSDHL